ncbi:MAG: thioredoxin domain-containing protein [Myxococcales bacterium]|nr:thioredoxin domain-containing protein [Myxococcales bacterium]
MTYHSAVAGARPHPALVAIRACALVSLAFSVMAAVEYYGGGGTFCSEAGDCARVRFMAGDLGMLLPAFGALAFTTLFALTLPKGRGFARIAAVAAVCGGLVAAYLIQMQSSLGAWCWLCLVTDSSAVLAAVAGAWLLARTPSDVAQLGPGFVTFWWAPFWIAVFGPVIYGTTIQDPPIPSQITELYEDGKVNVVELADFECPYCRAMHPVLRQAIEESGADVHLVRITYPLSFHERARPASAAYYCAVAEGQGEAMADRLFGGDLDRPSYLTYARDLGLDVDAFETCLDADSTEARIQEDLDLVDEFGMQGLPMVYIGGRTQRGFAPTWGPEVFAEPLEAAAHGEGRRIRWWPSVALLVLLGVSLWFPIRERRAPMAPETPKAPPDEAPAEEAPAAPKKKAKKASKKR